jgi:two-component system, OmpR family, phosphate regulon sensor histidine kinase PhoR
MTEGMSVGSTRFQTASGERADLPAHILDRLPHAVVALDRGLRVGYANPAADRLLGDGSSLFGSVLRERWLEVPLRELVEQAFEPAEEPEEARTTTAGNDSSYDVRVLPPDSQGQALLLIVDVSPGAQLVRAEREFVTNAAHQLRTPVAALASAIEVLQGGAKDVPEARDRFLAHLDSQCDRLVRLTRALLLLARSQALSEPPTVELVPLRPLLESIARGLRPTPAVRVLVVCPLDLAALTNLDLLEQALGNLAENAAKYTAEGEIALVASQLEEGAIELVVSDTGVGVDLPSASRFQRFYREPGAEGEGFGLGLAIAAEALRVLGGSLVVEGGSAGTRAVVTLPAAGTLKP